MGNMTLDLKEFLDKKGQLFLYLFDNEQKLITNRKIKLVSSYIVKEKDVNLAIIYLKENDRFTLSKQFHKENTLTKVKKGGDCGCHK